MSDPTNAVPATSSTPAGAAATSPMPQSVGTVCGPSKYLKSRIGGNRHGIELESVLPRALWGWELVPFTAADGRQGLACIACATPEVPTDIQQAAINNSFSTIFPLPEQQGGSGSPLAAAGS